IVACIFHPCFALATSDHRPQNPPSAANQSPQPAISNVYGHLSLSFEPNQGQADKDVQFLSRGPGFTLSLCDNEAIIRVEPARTADQEVTAANIAQCDKTAPNGLRMRIVGGTQRRASGGAALPGVSNYYFGQD